jgi:hypothetical protein
MEKSGGCQKLTNGLSEKKPILKQKLFRRQKYYVKPLSITILNGVPYYNSG